MSATKMFAVLLLCALVAGKSYEEIWAQDVKGRIIPPGSTASMYEQGLSLFTDIKNHVDSWLSANSIPKRAPPTKAGTANPYPYFGFIPFWKGAVRPNTQLQWTSRCFKTAALTVKQVTDDTYTLTFDFQGHTVGCTDFYWIATLEGAMFPEFSSTGQTYVNWTISSTANSADLYDINTIGFRVMNFNNGKSQIYLDVLNTVELLECFFRPEVTDSCAETNLYFMETYSGFTMDNRTSGLTSIDPSLIKDGDFFGVVRLDGIDPMLAWAMGSTTGHTSTALHINGSLHVCESTTLDAYWPVNGVQCTEWNLWVNLSMQADMNIVWAPLSSKYSSIYNGTAAYEFFQTVSGLDYGWNNLLYGWIDTIQNNYPCVPPYPSQNCLNWEIVEPLFGLLERISWDFVQKIFNQAMNIRLGTSGLNVSQILQTADEKKIQRNTLPTIVEEDTFLYSTTRNDIPVQGMSMVCCVFVCEMWKHGGIFNEVNNEINCAEFTNWDDYSLTLFDTSPRPQACIDADPKNQLCQLMGKYTLNLNDFNTKNEYPHMCENCPSQAPNYTKPANC